MKQSLWNHFRRKINFPEVDRNLETDVAVIGAGICGISVAQTLSGLGHKVVVLEANRVGGGTTAHSTGNLYATTDKNLKKLVDKHGLESIKVLTQARQQAIAEIEKSVKDFSIDCDFHRGPWYLYSDSEHSIERIEDEFKAALDLGLTVEPVDFSTPYKAHRAIKMHDQARINPLLYVQGLAEKIQNQNCQIFENTTVHSVSHSEDRHCLTTEKGNTIRSKYLVHATHTPKGVKMIQSYLGPYREYGIACKVKSSPVDGTFWGFHGASENFISSRYYERDGEQYLIVVGMPHKVGHESENEKCVAALKKFAEEHFSVQSVPFSWGGQHYRPADFLPYIGKEESKSTVYIATGFSTDGLVYGALSARVIGELIQEKESELSHLLRPYRGDYLKSLPQFLKENADVAVQYLKDLPLNSDGKDFSEVAPGEGKIIEYSGQKIAAYRNLQGQLSTCSAMCTHMKCIVEWNSLEKSWDCPCHGSRFEADGRFIEGPALHSLHKVNIEES